MLQKGIYTRQEIGKELGVSADKACNLIRKLKQLGYTVETNNKKGAGYRIIITDSPQTLNLNVSKSMEKKLLHLLFTLGNNKGLSFKVLEHYNYLTDKTIKKYIEQFEEQGIVEHIHTPVCYATKRRIVDDDELTDEEVDRGDYLYVIDVKEITEEEYDKTRIAYQQYYESHIDNPDMANDEVRFNAIQAGRDVLDGWYAMRSVEGTYRLKPQFLSLLEKALTVEDYQRLRRGNYLEDEKKWEERKERWEQERLEKKENYRLRKEIERLKQKLLEKGVDYDVE